MYSLDDNTPSEDNGKRVVPTGNVVNDRAGVQTKLRAEINTQTRDSSASGEGETYGVGDKVIEEPREGDRKESNPVALDDQPVRDLGVLHRIALEPLGLIHVQPPDEDGEGREDTETEGETPDGPEVVRSAANDIQR